jgi:hypothetical protein
VRVAKAIEARMAKTVGLGAKHAEGVRPTNIQNKEIAICHSKKARAVTLEEDPK